MSDVATRLSNALADRYRVEREIGAGGMATVYLAEDLKHKRRVAVKVLKPELAAVIGADRFLREIETIAGLQHPHILGLIDSGEVDGTAYYVMPFVDGESLRDRLSREKQLPVADAVRIATEVAGALDYAHRHGVIHRDIKPENILLHDGQALVADFGIALAVSTAGGARMTETGMSLGTPHYMSPEQAMGEREITARSDIYALGATTYEMLTGEPPFTGPTAQAIIAKVLTSDPVAPTSLRRTVPPGVEAAVLTALQKLPADRFSRASQFAEALASAAVPSSARDATAPVATPNRPSTRVRRAGLGVAAVAIATSGFLVGRGRDGSGGLSHVTFGQRTFAPQAVFAARFTHDGESIVFSASTDGNKPRVYVMGPGSPEPRALSAPGTQLLSVSSRDEMAVLVNAQYLGQRLFDGTLARMPLAGGAPRELLAGVREADWSPDGSELAIIHDVNGKDRLEYPIGKVLVESAGYLSDVRVSPDGGNVAFMVHPVRFDDRGVVSVVNVRGDRRILSNEYWGLEGIAWSADGRRLVFAAASEGGFYQIYSASLGGKETLVLPSAGTLTVHDASPTGRLLITRDDEDNRLLARWPGAAAETDVSWKERAIVPSISADGSMIAFTNAGRDAGSLYETMIRTSDGSPPVRLGEGAAQAVSPDKRWVISTVYSSPPRLMLYPVGAGQARRLDDGTMESYGDIGFFPDSRSILVCGSARGHAPRCYVRSLAAGPLRALTPEGTRANVAIAPDGKSVLAATAEGYSVYPVDGSAPHLLTGLSESDRVLRWSPDGRSVWLTHARQIPLKTEQLDVATGRRSALLVIPASRPGVVRLDGPSIADDLRAYTYTARELVSRIFVVDGVR